MKTSLLLISLALMSLSACHSKHGEEKKEAVKYIVTTPIVKDTAYTKEYVAQIQSLQNVEIHALDSRLELVETKQRQFNAIIDVYRALGGGWR
jgi:ABC-type uncharacterized transport system auxiliary subunit